MQPDKFQAVWSDEYYCDAMIRAMRTALLLAFSVRGSPHGRMAMRTLLQFRYDLFLCSLMRSFQMEYSSDPSENFSIQ